MPRKAKGHPSPLDWKTQAEELRLKAESLPHGAEREALIRQSSKLETASHMQEWLTSPGLAPPSR